MPPLNPNGLSGFGEALRRLRLHRNRTLTEVADAAGVSVSVLSRYESDQALPRVETLGKVLDGLGTDLLHFAVLLEIVQAEATPPTPLPAGLTLEEQSALSLVRAGFREFIRSVARRSGEPTTARNP